MEDRRYTVRLAARDGKLLGSYDPEPASDHPEVGSVIEVRGRLWRVVAVARSELGQVTLAVRPAAI